LPEELRNKQSGKEDEARCMLRYGIANVMGMHRTDTLKNLKMIEKLNDWSDKKLAQSLTGPGGVG
jgi:hypothetical protein